MPVTLTAVDIYYQDTPMDCVQITDVGSPPVTMYIPWRFLSLYDQTIMQAAETAFGAPLSYTDLETYILPNGMTFVSTYRALMRVHPAKPDMYGDDYDTVYYNGTVWKHLSDDQTVVP